MRVLLPAVDDPLTPARLPERGAVAGGDQTILVVEDDLMVRTLTARVLGGRGYLLLTAASGEEAMRLFAQHAGPVDLLLTDAVPPGLGGRGCAAWSSMFPGWSCSTRLPPGRCAR